MSTFALKYSVMIECVMNVICYEHGLLSTWSTKKGGLLTGLIWTCSLLNAVCN